MKNLAGYILVAAILGGVAFQWNAKRVAHAEIASDLGLSPTQSAFLDTCADALTTHKMAIIESDGSYGHQIPSDRACGCVAGDLGKLGTVSEAEFGMAEDLFEMQIRAAANNSPSEPSGAQLASIGSQNDSDSRTAAAINRRLSKALNSCAKLSRYVDAKTLAVAEAQRKWSQCIKSTKGDETICGDRPS